MLTLINGVRLWVETQGNTGPPVILVMGFGMSSRAWAPQIQGLRDHCRVTFFDNRGIGRSEDSAHQYSMAELARDVVGVMDHAGYAAAHIVGVSMGGMIAQHVALDHPERVLSMSLIATHPGGTLNGIPHAKGVKLFVRANFLKGEARMLALRDLLYPPAVLAKSGNEGMSPALMKEVAVPAPLAVIRRQFAAVMKHDTRSRLGELADTPSLIVRPCLDILVRPSNSDLLHSLIPGSHMVSFSDAGHAVTAQCARPLNLHLRAHFAGVDR